VGPPLRALSRRQVLVQNVDAMNGAVFPAHLIDEFALALAV
jgi:hypothetical protein